MASTRTKKTVSRVTESTEVKMTTPVVEDVVEKSEPVKAREFKADDPIPCTSIFCGELGMIGEKSGINYRWLESGDTRDVDYQDLVMAIRLGKKQVLAPYFIVQDEDFVNKFPQLRDVYAAIYSAGDLRKVITDLDPQSMRLTIQSLPEGAKESVKNIAANMVQNGQFDNLSIAKIKILDEIFETQLILLSDLVEH